ncbi:MAG: hypothetical protein ACI87E_003615 [Mariniblastus sp.]|jgi:hypothetical protein
MGLRSVDLGRSDHVVLTKFNRLGSDRLGIIAPDSTFQRRMAYLKETSPVAKVLSTASDGAASNLSVAWASVGALAADFAVADLPQSWNTTRPTKATTNTDQTVEKSCGFMVLWSSKRLSIRRWDPSTYGFGVPFGIVLRQTLSTRRKRTRVGCARMKKACSLNRLRAVRQITVVAGVARRENHLRIPNCCQSGYIQIGHSLIERS